MATTPDQFPTGIAGLPQARPTELVALSEGDAFRLRVAPVAKQLGDMTVRMLAYNGSIPGPTLVVREGSQVAVEIENQADLETTVHWHGLRLENRYDGTHETQPPIRVGDSFTAQVQFPDPGMYWYHPHIREDYGQELGLYGNVLVQPADPEYWPPAHREVAVTLDDVLLEQGAIAPFSRTEPTHSAMGRFGDVLLANGDPDLRLEARTGEVVRFYLTNTANTRVFRIRTSGGRMKLVGGDSGRVEREEFVDHVIIAPSERVAVDVLFGQAGEAGLVHESPRRVHRMVTVEVLPDRAEPPLDEAFEQLRTNGDMVAQRQRIASYLTAPPDKTLAFLAEMDVDRLYAGTTPDHYACPMHPEVVDQEPSSCPKCGMRLLPVQAPVGPYTCPMHPDVVQDGPGHCPQCGMKLMPQALVATAEHGGHEDHHMDHGDHGHAGHENHAAHADHGEHQGEAGATHQDHPNDAHPHDSDDGIEWEDDMVEVNRLTTPASMRWKLVDVDTGAVNGAIDWAFTVGDQVKIRLRNEMAGDHPMHHPFHVHGAGRFLVLSRDGVTEPNLVWKDTVLVRAGETVDILLDVTNQGRWMAHCHIAEHHEAGMMFSFDVGPAAAPAGGA